MSSMSGHQRPYRGKSDTWLTPPEIIRELGPFDLDPCCPETMPWTTATVMQSLPRQNGLETVWAGRVWLNPPYGPEVGKWLAKLAEHGDGIALIFARTETEMFFDCVWSKAWALHFLKGRIHFHHTDGTRAKFNSGAPSVLVAYGQENAEVLSKCNIDGQFVPLRWFGRESEEEDDWI
jgi:hypothetical protein